MSLGEWGVTSLDINARFASGRLLVSNLAICASLWVISLWSSSFIILFDSTLFGLFVSVTSQHIANLLGYISFPLRAAWVFVFTTAVSCLICTGLSFDIIFCSLTLFMRIG